MVNVAFRHILSKAVNLTGCRMLVITYFYITNLAKKSILGNFSTGVAFLLSLSCFLSFISIRSKKEKIADYLFLLSLLGFQTIILLIIFHIIK